MQQKKASLSNEACIRVGMTGQLSNQLIKNLLALNALLGMIGEV